MSCDGLPPLDEFVALVRATDEDARHRLRLLDQIAPVLYHGAGANAQAREVLADKLERWRYQWLNKVGGQLTKNQRELIDVLDLAANAMMQRQPRPPMSPRSILESNEPQGSIAARPAAHGADSTAEWAIDPRVPVEQVIHLAQEQTRRQFGQAASDDPPGNTADFASESLSRQRWRMLLYAPLYLSSYCINHCLYCHFRFPNTLQRDHLGTEAALSQAEFLGQRGIRHVLLVAGDDPQLTTTDYYAEMVWALADRGFRVAVEIAPQSTSSYAKLVRAGACGIALYQETYQEDYYARYHPRGTKVWFDWRLEGPERAAQAGMSRGD